MKSLKTYSLEPFSQVLSNINRLDFVRTHYGHKISMKMKTHTKNLLIGLLGIPFLLGTQSLSYAAEKKAATKPSAVAAGPSCLKEKAEFKQLYIELQKSLNYEGKDAYLDAKGALQLKPHAKDAAYEGKVFEEALFKEYQNSLRKVALMYQSAKFDDAAPADFKSNPALVDFIKAIDGNDGAKYISANNVNSVIDGLQKASVSKYPADSKFRINENDKYLLKKLLTHAQDRLCSIEKYQETGKRDRNFTAEELEKKKNAPLNQLILAVKDAKITKDSDIKLEDIVDEKTAINSAIAANINALSAWAKNNKGCIAAIKSAGTMNMVQSGIQACNYRKFVDALSDENVTNIESILHFINSNEKFLKGAQAKAETSMDELKLQAYVDRTFANLGNKINCTEIPNANKVGKRLFVRNLAYNDATNKFDTSKLSCKIKVAASKKGPASERVLTEQECNSKIELISDEFGRGLEVKQKNPKEAAITFSVKDNPECNDIVLVEEPVKPEPPRVTTEPLTDAICAARGEALPKKIVMILTTETTPPSCRAKFTDEICKKQGEAQKSPILLIAKEDASACIPDPASACKAEGKEFDTEKKECKPAGETEASCKEKKLEFDAEKKACKPAGETETSCKEKKLDFDAEKKECKPAGETEASCKEKKLDFDAEKKACKPAGETEASCKEKKLEFDAEKKECKPAGETEASCKEKKLDFDAEKKACKPKEEVAVEDPEAKKCEEKNAELRKANEGRPTEQWIIKDGKCIDSKYKAAKSKDTEFEDDEKPVRADNSKFQAPARFTPINIPTRQMYILPGMP